ncbi:MAG: hypothetical protein QMD71_06255 [bacterium]|nr:hypothetical protein [bacterium]
MFRRKAQVVTPDWGKRIVSVKIRLVGKNFSGTLYITDLMFQGGTISTEWTGHPSEIKWVM